MTKAKSGLAITSFNRESRMESSSSHIVESYAESARQDKYNLIENTIKYFKRQQTIRVMIRFVLGKVI